jgi:hypothetical protein
MLADELDHVVGVDPHRDAHALAIVQAGTGAALLSAQVAASEHGYAEALRLAEREAPGRRAWAIEGTGSYGAGLARFLARRGERVLEVGRTRRERRSHAKTDAIDALRAARSVLGEAKLASPRAGGEREALRALMVARAVPSPPRKRASASCAPCSSPAPSRCAQSCAHSRGRGCSVAFRRCAPTSTETRSCAARSSRSARSPAVSKR